MQSIKQVALQHINNIGVYTRKNKKGKADTKIPIRIVGVDTHSKKLIACSPLRNTLNKQHNNQVIEYFFLTLEEWESCHSIDDKSKKIVEKKFIEKGCPPVKQLLFSNKKFEIASKDKTLNELNQNIEKTRHSINFYSRFILYTLIAGVLFHFIGVLYQYFLLQVLFTVVLSVGALRRIFLSFRMKKYKSKKRDIISMLSKSRILFKPKHIHSQT